MHYPCRVIFHNEGSSLFSVVDQQVEPRGREGERGMVEARRKRATWPIPPGAGKGEGWKERGCKPARHKGKHTSAGAGGKRKGLLWRQDDAMLQPPHLLVAHPPRPTTDIDTGRASIRVLERGEWREASSRVTRLLAVSSRVGDWSEVIGVIYLLSVLLKRGRDRSYAGWTATEASKRPIDKSR